MVAGRIIDPGDKFLFYRRRWYSGRPRMGFFGVKKDGPAYDIETFRCAGCGTLESVAVES